MFLAWFAQQGSKIPVLLSTRLLPRTIMRNNGNIEGYIYNLRGSGHNFALPKPNTLEEGAKLWNYLQTNIKTEQSITVKILSAFRVNND